MTFKLLDLFSGIGGFSLGLERSGGFETMAFCEIDPFCRKVLKKHWPHVPQYDDIKILTAERLRADGIVPDAICGGFPCQDISVAGAGAGLDGERSGLWFEYARLISEIRPRVVIVENVGALLVRGLSVILGNLATLGYDAEWDCTSAIESGLLPTLTITGNYNYRGCSPTSGDGLATILRRLPTLTRHDYRGGAKPERTARMRETSSRGCDLPSELRQIYPESTGIINPLWAEGYMGFPIGWTELKRSETLSCRKSRK
jgi:hypothetical protein